MKTSRKNNEKKHTRILLFLSMLSIAPIAQADLVDTLGNALTYMTGPLGKTIAGLAIAGVGYSCFVLGKVSKNVFMTTVIGIGIIFGVSAILSMLGVS